MHERKIIKIPDGVAPSVKEIIAPIIGEINAGGMPVDTSGSDESTYGHAMRALINSAFGSEERTEQQQLALMKERAQKLVDIYGPKIIEKMDPKLVEALGL